MYFIIYIDLLCDNVSINQIHDSIMLSVWLLVMSDD